MENMLEEKVSIHGYTCYYNVFNEIRTELLNKINKLPDNKRLILKLRYGVLSKRDSQYIQSVYGLTNEAMYSILERGINTQDISAILRISESEIKEKYSVAHNELVKLLYNKGE